MNELRTTISEQIALSRQVLRSIQPGQKRWYERKLKVQERIRVYKRLLITIGRIDERRQENR